MSAPSGCWLPTAVTVTVSWLAGVPTVIRSPAAKPSARRIRMRVAPALTGAERLVRPAGRFPHRHRYSFNTMADAVDIQADLISDRDAGK